MKMGRTEKVSYCQILKYLPQEQRNCTLIYQEKMCTNEHILGNGCLLNS